MDQQSRYLFRHASLLDVEQGELLADRNVLVEGERIVELGGSDVQTGTAHVLDLHGRTLMPGLIDAHVHVTAVTADLVALSEWSAAYVTARAGRVLLGMLERGFTTVRDVGGAEYGLALAVEEGYLQGPRIVFGGKALSQTGGHADLRRRGRETLSRCLCSPG
jgi:imidazolonepropionase-like amidohydrolase